MKSIKIKRLLHFKHFHIVKMKDLIIDQMTADYPLCGEDPSTSGSVVVVVVIVVVVSSSDLVLFFIIFFSWNRGCFEVSELEIVKVSAQADSVSESFLMVLFRTII